MKNTLYWIWLSILNLRQKHKNILLKIYKEPKELYKISKKELEKITNSNELIEIILSKKIKEKAKRILSESKGRKIKVITIEDKEYPKRLKQIENAPFVIYAKGEYKLLNEEKNNINCRLKRKF